MGRFPFVTYINRYVMEYEPYLAKTTLDEQARKLRYIGRTLQQLKEDGRIETVDPRKISEKEVGEYMKWMKQHGMEVNGQVKYLQAFNNLLRFCDNSTIDRMRKKRLLPKKKLNEIDSLTEQEIEHIINSTSKIPGWRGVKAKFICAMYSYTGLRPQALRLAQLVDLDVKKWEFWVRNPKGKNRYGVQRTVPIPPPIRLFVHDFLHERKEYLTQKGFHECEPLIPKITEGKVGYYSSNNFRQLKKEISECSGIDFSLKTFRASYAQMLKDRVASIESISKLMGHHTTKTTETYYARIKDSSVFNEINSIWSEPTDAKKCEIEFLAR
ncbi:MAG: site-specific integrase [Methanomassiliicoccales archaeon]|nr:MAG: site-specific integrase [Methanomassiliicoccales archaeon]